LERQRFAIADFLEGKGFSSDRYRARKLAENLTFLSEFIPGFGEAQGGREAAHMWGEGDRMMGGIMMASVFMPFVPGSKLIKPFKALQEQIDKLKFDRKREVINLPYDGTPAQRSIDRIDNEIRGLTEQQRRLVEEAPPDQLVKPGQDVVPSGGSTGGTGGTGSTGGTGGTGGARPVAGEHIPAGERDFLERVLVPPLTQTGRRTRSPSGGITDLPEAQSLTDVLLDIARTPLQTQRRGAPSPERDFLERALVPPLTQTGRRTRASSRQPEQEDMLTRLQNLKIDKND